VEPLNAWIGRLFESKNVDRTVEALVASQGVSGQTRAREAAKKRLTDAEARLRRFQDAIGAGIDPTALVDVINEAHAQRAAARAELDGAPAPDDLTSAEVHAMIDSLGDVASVLFGADPENLERLYGMLRLELLYHPLERTVDARLAPRVISAWVRGAIAHNPSSISTAGFPCALRTRLYV